MKVHVSLNVASVSAVSDPVVRFVRNLREAAYGAGDNQIKKLLSEIDPEHVPDMNIVVLGTPSLTATSPAGFVVEDMVDDTIPVTYIQGARKVRDAKHSRSDGVTVNVDGKHTYFKVLMRMPFDSF